MDKQIVESGLLKFCRFYDPGKPVEEQDLMASYEQKWMEFLMTDPDQVDRLVAHYVQAGLESFHEDDGVPLGLKALLYGRYSYWNPYSPEEGFKDWYLETYYSKKKL